MGKLETDIIRTNYRENEAHETIILTYFYHYISELIKRGGLLPMDQGIHWMSLFIAHIF